MLYLTLLDVLFDDLFNYECGYLEDGLNQLLHLRVFLFVGDLHKKEQALVPVHAHYFTFRLLRRKFCPDPFLDGLNVQAEFS